MRWGVSPTVLVPLFSLVVAAPSQPTPGTQPASRLDWSLLPALAGNTDIGFLFGALGVLAMLEERVEPYRWRGQAIAVMSIKSGPDGAEFPIQNFDVQWDLLGLAGGRLRVYPRVLFRRTINRGYYGIGNASSAHSPPEDAPNPGYRYRYIRMEPRVQVSTQVELFDALDLMLGLKAGHVVLTAPEGSKLEEDFQQPPTSLSPVREGAFDHTFIQFAAGLIWDTRDHEFIPTSGMLNAVSVRLAPGSLGGPDYHFGGFNVHGRFFVPLYRVYLVLAARVMVDLLYGHPPFYELSRAGAFFPIGLPGGGRGIRGVPEGRFHGRIKIAATAELRSMFLRFSVWGRRFWLGAAAFADTGRVWADYHSNPELDGSGLGLKYGVGGGLRLMWGAVTLIRLDISYSPNAIDDNPDLPVGIYFDLGQAF